MAFANLEQSGIIVFVVFVYSVNYSDFFEEKTFAHILLSLYSFMVNQTKFLQVLTPIINWAQPSFSHKRLHSNKRKGIHCCTCCTGANIPMRTYPTNKKSRSECRSREGCIPNVQRRFAIGKKIRSMQFLKLKASPRIDIEFISYCLSDDSIDDHLVNIHDLSLFSIVISHGYRFYNWPYA